MSTADMSLLKAEICGDIDQAIKILQKTRKAVQRMEDAGRLASYGLLSHQNVEILEQERELLD